MSDERVSIRWLESFANFARSATSHQVRFATGLFSALSGARDEARSRESPIESDGSGEPEDDFFDYIDSELEQGHSSLVSHKFILINALVFGVLLLIYAALSELKLIDDELVFLTGLVTLCAYVVVLVGYVIWKFHKIMTRRMLPIR